MTKEEILDKYYLLTESQEEFDKVLEIFDEYKGTLNSKHYFNFKSNTYLFFSKKFLLIRHCDSSDNRKNFITFDKLLDLLDDNTVDKLLNVPILVQTRDEWDDVISYFIENNVEINFSVGDFEPAYYLVYDSMTEFIEYTEFITESDDYYKDSISYNEFCKIVSKVYNEEELTKDKLKYIVTKYLIRNKDVNNSYSDLLGFVNEINERFNLRIL